MSRKVNNETRRGWELSAELAQIDLDKDYCIPADISIHANGTLFMTAPNGAYFRDKPQNKLPKTWMDYVWLLPTWERDLISITDEPDNTIGLSMALQDEKATILVVSDGSCKDGCGSFGWAIGTQFELLWEGAGVARGSPMTAYRAEAYGKLAWLCFLEHYSTFMGIEIKCEILSYCDNSEVIKQSRFNKNPASAGEAKRADYDVINQIQEVQEQLRKRSKLRQSQHVKGHQDKTKDQSALTRQEELNIHVDAIAGRALKHTLSGATPPKMIALPACRAYLLSSGEIQTSKELWTCRWKWSDFRIQKYHCARLGISSKTLHRINWEAFRIARKRLTTTEQAFATKLMTRWLPTGHQVQKYGGQLTACHRCGDNETVDHLFQCKSNKNWSRGFINRLNRFLVDIKTGNGIRKALISGITKWLDEDSMTSANRCPRSMRQCYYLQDEIGWNLAMCGLLDENWSAFQSATLAEEHDKPRNIGQEWSIKLTCWLVREARSLWLTRNDEVHTPNDGCSKSELEVLEQVRNLYKLEGEMSQHDRAMFDVPIEDKLQQPIKSLRRWVKNTIPTASRCIRDFKEKIRSKQKDIRSYFTSTSKSSATTNATTTNDNFHQTSSTDTLGISDRTLGATLRREHYQAFRRPPPTRDKNQDSSGSTAETSTTLMSNPHDDRSTMTAQSAQPNCNNLSG